MDLNRNSVDRNSKETESWEQTGKGYPHRWLILPLVCLPTFAMLLDGNIVFIALSAIGHSFPNVPNLREWVLASFSLVAAALSLPAGEMGDRLGLRKVFAWGLWLFLLGSLLCFFAGSATVLIGGRIICACGAAILAPVALAFLRRLFPSEEQAIAFGYWSASVTLGTVLGPFLGGFIQHIASWHWVFFAPMIPVAIGLCGLPFVPTLPPRKTLASIDYQGLITIAFGIFLSMFFLIESPKLSLGINIALLSSLLLTLVFWWQSTKNNPAAIISPQILSQSSWYIPSCLQFLVRALFVFVMTSLTVYFQEARGLSALTASISILPLSVVSGVMSLSSGYLKRFLGVRYLMMGVFAFTAIGFWHLHHISVSGLDSSNWLGMVAFGILYGNTAQLSHQALSHFSNNQAMRGSAINTMIINFGLAFGAAIHSLAISFLLPFQLKQQPNWRFPVEIPSSLQQLFNLVNQNTHTTFYAQSLKSLQESLVNSYGLAFIGCAILCLLASITASQLKKQPAKTTT